MATSTIHLLNKDLLNKEEFTSNGTFNVPKGVNRVFVEGWGGGGGGQDSAPGAGGAGGFGALRSFRVVDVTPGAAITVTIGAGGTSSSGVGNPGGDTTFGGLATFKGASGVGQTGTTIDAIDPFGVAARRQNPGGGTPGGYGGDGTNPASDGWRNEFYLGGSAPGSVNIYDGGGGGAGPGGPGGNGGDNSLGSNAAANSGAGGGGGSNGPRGGTGGSGKLIVYWIDPQ